VVRRPRVTVKSTSAAAVGWVYKYAKRLGQSLMARTHMRKNQVVDGFILQAVRTGDQARVTILDTPALIAVPGRILHLGVSPVSHCPLISMAAGRAAMLRPAGGAAASAVPSHPGTNDVGFLLLGGIDPSRIFTLTTRVRPSMADLPGYGVVHTTVVNRTAVAMNVNAYAFMGPADRVVYQLRCYAPTVGQGTYVANPAGGWSTERSTPYPSPLSVAMSDDVMVGVLPFCRRTDPPPYNPGDTSQTLYSQAQNVWARVVSAGFSVVDGVTHHDMYVVVHVVCDLAGPFDRFGARGLWFGHLRVRTGPIPGPTVSVVSSAVVDMRDSGDPRSTPEIDTPGTYNTNNNQPAMVCLLSTGHVIALVVSNCSQEGYADPGEYQVFATTTVYRMHPATGAVSGARVMGPTLSTLSLNLPMQPHDGAFPVGIDTDGTVAYAVLFSTDSARQLGFPYNPEPSIDIVRVTADSQSVVLSTTSGGRRCFFADATCECVRYIGNNKFVYVATSQISGDLPTAKGNLALYVYDAGTNSVALVGVVDGALRYPEFRRVGRLDCPVLELAAGGVVTRRATILLTTGSTGQDFGEPGGEDGTTYASYDSGSTWSVLAGYGSAAGVRYCGTVLQSRAKEL